MIILAFRIVGISKGKFKGTQNDFIKFENFHSLGRTIHVVIAKPYKLCWLIHATGYRIKQLNIKILCSDRRLPKQQSWFEV